MVILNIEIASLIVNLIWNSFCSFDWKFYTKKLSFETNFDEDVTWRDITSHGILWHQLRRPYSLHFMPTSLDIGAKSSFKTI